jgi:single-strand DNA-binding protein
MNLNKIQIIGNICRPPESRVTQSGLQACSFPVAVNEGTGDKKTTAFFDVTAFGKTAELCAQYLSKGQEVYVEGKIKLDEYTAKDGTQRAKLSVAANAVQFGARPQERSQQEAPQQQYQARPDTRIKPPIERDEYPRENPDQGTDDDLPF